MWSKTYCIRYEAEKSTIIKDLYVKDTSAGDIVRDESRLTGIIDAKMTTFEEPVSGLESTTFSFAFHRFLFVSLDLADNYTTLLARVLDDNAKYLAARRENQATKEREAALAR